MDSAVVPPRQPRITVKRVLLALGLTGLAIAAWFWWSRPDPAPTLATTAAQIADIEDTVVATGTIEASQLVSVGAQASGQIKTLTVKAGDQVKLGDLIAEIDSTTQANNQRNAQAAVATVRAQRVAQVALMQAAQLAAQRQQVMLAAEATSKAESESAQANLVAARAQIAVLDAQIEQAQTALATASANLGYTRITAPIDGTVVAVVAKEGQTVNANQSTPTIVKLAKLDTVTVSAEISEADVVKVKAGQPIYFTILGDVDKRYPGILRSVEPAPDSVALEASASTNSSAVYYNALFDVENPDGVLRIAMTAQVYVVLAQARAALTIPSAALGARAKDGSYAVQVVDKDGKVTPRNVTVGINNNAFAQVLSGVTAGELVVVGEAVPSTLDAAAKLEQQRAMRRAM